MKVPASQYRSPLGVAQPLSPDLEMIKRDGWREQHILVIAENDDRLDFIEREFIRRLGRRLYGDPHHG
ncbi:hypothetical protein [Burkholderia pseudomallei]|uniref:hypothetical protein n=1 Tax=Burkholderia pseudomallei TaxID=28450 RepID=UPI0018C7BB97|nr:hypothetical protein [Burkholderia pseudomallei]MBG1252182.1 hypothetical protein [Burkholderia pseudomallei]